MAGDRGHLACCIDADRVDHGHSLGHRRSLWQDKGVSRSLGSATGEVGGWQMGMLAWWRSSNTTQMLHVVHQAAVS